MALRCPQCTSDKIIPNAEVLDQASGGGGELQVAVLRNPKALFFHQQVMRTVKAQVCGACGHVQLIAEDPGALYAAYQESLRS